MKVNKIISRIALISLFSILFFLFVYVFGKLVYAFYVMDIEPTYQLDSWGIDKGDLKKEEKTIKIGIDSLSSRGRKLNCFRITSKFEFVSNQTKSLYYWGYYFEFDSTNSFERLYVGMTNNNLTKIERWKKGRVITVKNDTIKKKGENFDLILEFTNSEHRGCQGFNTISLMGTDKINRKWIFTSADTCTSSPMVKTAGLFIRNIKADSSNVISITFNDIKIFKDWVAAD